jgi:glyoxylase-like metal-dependent hydrolase (beta-lactamase superfamily II)
MVVSAQFRIPEQIPEGSRNDILVKSRSIEQPQLSQYPVELPEGNPLTMLPVSGNVYMIAGPNTGNVAVHIGDDGVVLVDSGSAAVSEFVQQAVRAVSRQEVNFIIMSGPNEDHFGGNGALAAPPFGRPPNQNPQGLGGPVQNTIQPPNPAQGGGRGGINNVNSATIIGHENTLNRLSAPTGQQAEYPFELWPTSTFFTPKKTLSWSGEPIEIISEAGATTDGDVMVFFRRSDVIASGDVIDTLGYPKIDLARGGSIAGVLEALNDIIEMTVPSFNQQGGTKVIPGHGRILNEADVVEYRDMMTIIHDRVKFGIEKNMTLAQIKAQRPTLDYDGLYSRPDWTGEQLIDVIYEDLRSAR